MKTTSTATRHLAAIFVLAPLLALSSWAGPPQAPATPAAVKGLLFVQPFTLQEPHRSEWQAERPLYSRGLLVVLEVDPALLFPRQSLEPVLYVGERVAERINVGYPSGRLVAVVPGEVDLRSAPVWLGAPDLPERVTAEEIARQQARAAAAGIRPFSEAAVRRAEQAGGEAAALADRGELQRHAAQLILRFAPDEWRRAEGLLAPVVGGS